MGQVTIYLEEALEKKMRATAQALNLSKSKWIAGVIQEKLDNEWPDSVHSLAGAWSDFPTLDDIRQSHTSDSPREML